MGKKSSPPSNKNGASSNSSGTSRIKAVSFGRNYFYQRGSDEDVETVDVEEYQEQQQLAKSSTTKQQQQQQQQFPWKDRLPSAAVCTAQSTIVLTQQGHVYQTGTLHGRLYEGWTRIPCPLPLNCVQLSAGRHFVVARLEGGQAVVTWGAGHFGQLGVTESSTRRGGDDDDDDYGGSTTTTTAMMHAPEPVLVQRLLPAVTGSPIRQVAAGDWHCLALTVSGTVWCWGSNRSLQCGVKHPSSNSHHGSTLALPRPIATLPEMIQIAAGRSHSVALSKAGSNNSSTSTTSSSAQIYAWGASQHGQCGTGICTRRGVPGLLPAAIDTLPAGLEMVQIAAAGHHTLALSKAGRVFSWGDGREGQLGLSLANSSSSSIDNSKNAIDIAQLQTSKPRLVGDLDFVAVAAGQEWKLKQQQQEPRKQESADGLTTPAPTSSSSSSAAEALKSIPKIVSVHAAASYSAALSSSGHVYCWGSNDVGQLGVPTPSDLPWCDGSIDLERMVNDETSSDAEPQPQRQTEPSARLLHARNFDSNHNVLLPVRVEGPLQDVWVSSLAMGPNHMWCFGEKRESNETVVVGRTLWEVQEEQRRKRLASIRSRLQQLHQQQQQAGERGELSMTNAVAATGPPQLPDEIKPPKTTTTVSAEPTEMAADTTNATLTESELAVEENDVAPTPTSPLEAADSKTPAEDIIEPEALPIQDIAGAGTISPSSSAAAAATANTSGSSGSTSEEEEISQSTSALMEQSDSYNDVSNTSAQEAIEETLPVVIETAAAAAEPSSQAAMSETSTATRQKRPGMLRRLSKKLRRRRSSRSSGSSTAEMGGGGGAADGSESTSTSTRRHGLRGIQEVIASGNCMRG